MNFKFDKEGSDIDLSMGSDDGVVLPKKPPISKPAMPAQRTPNVPVANKPPVRVTQNIPNSSLPPQRQAAPTRAPQPERRSQPAPVRRTEPAIQETPARPLPGAQEAQKQPYRAPEETRISQPQPTAPSYTETPRNTPTPAFDYSYQPSAEETQWESNPNPTIETRFQNTNPNVQQPIYSEPISYPEPSAPEAIVDKKTKSKLLGKKTKTEKAVPEKKISSLRGGRRGVVIGKVAISGILLILCFVGAKSIFFPTQFPSPAQIIAVVKDDLNVTKFPVDRANSFVINFTKAYLTVTPEQESTVRDNILRQYASDGVLNSMQMSINNSPDGTGVKQQTVTSEPIITGVESVDDTNAIFTVQTQVSSGSTLLLSIPVYYDGKTNAFAVSAPASILPATGLAQVPNNNHKIEWTNDSDVVKVLSPDLENYLKAWGASDSDIIQRYISPNATLTTKTGLGGSVVFSKITDLTVEFKAEDSGEKLNEREARFSVEWADAKTPNIVYNQTYKLDIFEQPDKRWYIKDISSVITEPKN